MGQVDRYNNTCVSIHLELLCYNCERFILFPILNHSLLLRFYEPVKYTHHHQCSNYLQSSHRKMVRAMHELRSVTLSGGRPAVTFEIFKFDGWNPVVPPLKMRLSVVIWQLHRQDARAAGIWDFYLS